MTEHLDLDALADVLAADVLAPEGPARPEGPAATAPGSTDHLTGCTACQASLAELRNASASVSRALSQLPAPALPAEVATRLSAAVRAAPPITAPPITAPPASEPAARPVLAPVLPLAGQTTLPAASSRPTRRWLPVAAAVLMVLAGAGYGVSRLSASSSVARAGRAGTADTSAAGSLHLTRNNTGTDYADRAGLLAALPRLLAGGSAGQRSGSAGAAAPAPAGAPLQKTAPQLAAADPLARLRTPGGLADCLLALLPPSDPSLQPLAVDYAAFKGTPAMVVVLPSTAAGKLDVFVVGASCTHNNDSTLFYASANRP